MFGFLRNFNLDRNSFWVGFIVGSLFWWLLGYFRPLVRRAFRALRAQVQQTREGLAAGGEIRLANDTLRRVQHLHIAAPLFSLDEVRIAPRILAPPPRVTPGEEPHLPDIVGMTVPYNPDWPEAAGAYNARTLSLPEALSGGANLILMGRPGAGKTFALADLASQLVREESGTEVISTLIPLYLHVFDLEITAEDERHPLDALIAAAGQYASALTGRQLPNLLETALESGRLLLLLDGVDELAQEEIDLHVTFLRELQASYPKLRAVVATSALYYSELRTLNFIPVAIAAWGEPERTQFINQWTDLWIRFVNPDIWDIPQEIDSFEPEEAAVELSALDPLLLNGWLSNNPRPLSPLETTLQVWAVYAGDMLGARPALALEAYLRRMTVALSNSRPALEQLAMRLAANQRSIINRGEVDAAGALVDSFGGAEEVAELPADTGEGDDEMPAVEPEEGPGEQISVRRSISRLLNSGILVNWPGGRISFVHPVIFGYLAGSGFASQGGREVMLSQPEWTGKSLSLEYLASMDEAGSLVVKLLDKSEEPLLDGLFTAARWLKNAPDSASWRAIVLRRLAKLVQNELYSTSMRSRAMVALGSAQDKDVAVLFRHLHNSDSAVVRQLSVLGSGLIKDPESVNELAVKLYDPAPNVRRAACLALVKIGSAGALEQVASALLHGDEDLRRAAAEAFANHPEEGYPLLKDGAELDDLLVRRAVVFGLQRVNEDWSDEILTRMQVEDSQWVVRNAAMQAIEEAQRPNPHIPAPLAPPHECGWLIGFASERGMGVTQGKPALEMLKLALKEGKLEERLAVLEYVHQQPDTGMLLDVYHMLYGTEDELREAAYQTLWHLNAEGIDLPPPTRYGLGA